MGFRRRSRRSNVRSDWDPLTHGIQKGKFASPFNIAAIQVGHGRGALPGNRVLIEGPVFRLLPTDAAAKAAVGRSARREVVRGRCVRLRQPGGIGQGGRGQVADGVRGD